MRRREFIALVGSAAARPFGVRAQQPTMPVIGWLDSEPAGASPELAIAGFLQSLSDAGYVEGRNVTIEYRSGGDKNDRLLALARDLVGRQVTVIAAHGTSSALAARAATQTIPIVFMTGQDPVHIGLVPSLNLPGGNITGITVLTAEITGKRLELLREVVPTVATVAVLVDPTNPVAAEGFTREVEVATRVLGLRTLNLNASTSSEIEAAFATIVEQRANALLINGYLSYFGRRDLIGALASRHRVPTMYAYREYTAAGGLASYGPNLPEVYRLVGSYTGRILKGEKPSDMPVHQVTKFELVINLKTAKALGLTIPPSLLARADEVIE